MSKSNRADWAAQVPWDGITDKPLFLDGPNGAITIDDVEGLRAALANKQNTTGLARVAYTGQYSDLLNKPLLGSAAFANVSDFQAAYTARTLQTGAVPFVAGQQSYAVAFTRTMNAIPKVYLQVEIDSDAGELFSATVENDTLTATGFTFWLSGVPNVSAGKCRYRAIIEEQP